MSASGTLTLRKEERTCSKKLIEQLFNGGTARSMSSFPLRAVYMLVPRTASMPPAQMMVSVPKRCFKHAVDRNLVKRQVREAYRKNKQMLLHAMESHEKEGLVVSFIWLENKLHDSHSVEHHIVELLRHISERL